MNTANQIKATCDDLIELTSNEEQMIKTLYKMLK